jgi:hypothetical protein
MIEVWEQVNVGMGIVVCVFVRGHPTLASD